MINLKNHPHLEELLKQVNEDHEHIVIDKTTWQEIIKIIYGYEV